MDRIGLLVELMGNEKAIRSLRQLHQLSESLKNKRLQLRVDKNEIQKEMNSVRRQLDQLYKYRRTLSIKFDQAEIHRVNKEIQDLTDKLHELQRTSNEIQVGVNYNNLGLQAIRETVSEARTLQDILGSIGSGFSSIGSGLQRMGSLFNTNIMDYAKQFLTWGVTDNIMGNLQSAATRFDTLNTYSKYLEIIGVNASDADRALSNIDQAVQGLPIGLDKAAFQARRYAMYLGGDMEKAQNLVIGLNQALIAGGAPEYMRTTAEYEIDRLLATGDLATSRQWMALLNGLGTSTVFLKDQLGYADKSLEEFVSDMTSSDGPISGQQFLEGMMALADDKNLNEKIKIYKSTLESGMSNIHYAFVRGIQHIYSAVDEYFQGAHGMTISDYLYEGRDMINQAFQGVVDWINENPDQMAAAFERLHGLVDRVAAFDWPRLGESVIGSIEKLFDIMTFVYDHIPPSVINGFLTFSMVWASPIGKAFSALGMLFTGLSRIPVPRNFGRLTRGVTQFGRFGGALKTSLGGIARNFLGVSSFIGVIAEIGGVIFEFTKVAETISKANLRGFDRNIGTVVGFLTEGGGLAALLTGLFGVVSAVPGGAGIAGLGELLAAGFVGIIGEIGGVINEFTTVAENIAKAKLPKQAKIEELFEIIKTITSSVTDAKISLGTGWRTKQIERIMEMLQGIADTLPSLKTISEADIDTSKLNTVVQQILGAYEIIDSTIESFIGEFENRTNLWINSWADAHIIDNISDIFNELVGAIDSIGGIENKLNEYGFFSTPNGGENQTVTRIRDSLETILEMMNGVNDVISEKKGPFKVLAKKIKTGIEKDIVKNWEDTIEAITSLTDTLFQNQDTLNAFGTTQTIGGSTATMPLQVLKLNIKTLLDQISNGKDGILDDIYTKITAMGRRSEKQDWAGLGVIVGNMDSAISAIANIAQTLRNNLGFFAFAANNTGAGTFANLKTVVEGLADLKEPLLTLNDFSVDNLTENMTSINTAIDSVKGIIEKLQGMQETLQAATGEEGVVANLKKFLTDLMNAFGGADGADSTALSIEAVASAIDELKLALTDLSQVSFGDLTQSAKDATDGTNELMEKIKELAKKMTEASKNADKLKKSISDLGDTAIQKSSSFGMLINAIKRVNDTASAASSSVTALANAMASLNDKSVTLTVNTPGLDSAISGFRTLNAVSAVSGNTSRPAGISGLPVQTASTGGKIAYLARGGSPFKPKGTDTVPAMLTPGEWVINRKASKAFGDTFMQRVNSLDITGAMDALMSRSRWVPNGGISNYTTNNYDNHAIINQHFHGNKDSRSSYRRASRYIGAL